MHAKVRKAIAAGKTREQAMDEITVSAYANLPGGAARIRMNVAAIYDELKAAGNRNWNLDLETEINHEESTVCRRVTAMFCARGWTLENTAARKQNVAVARLIRTSWQAKPT